MATKLAQLSAASHTAGLYSAGNVDGEEIGTLVVILDRARNLPNLKSLGKQDVFVAARLGKYAKRTESDRRGGQTPRWDQELRFTVFDSPDYLKLKVSAFTEDKRTDLIGEAWIDIEDILKPGGGQADGWHQLNVRGRSAGQLRLELTYYDTRPKVERSKRHSAAPMPAVAVAVESEPTASSRRPVGKRPLPSTTPAARAAEMLPPLPAAQPVMPAPPMRGQDSHNNLVNHSVTRQAPRDLIQGHVQGYHYDANDFVGRSEEDDHQDYSYTTRHSRSGPQTMSAHHGSLPRNDRVNALSGHGASRPLPPVALAHANSAPHLGLHEQDYQDHHANGPVEHKFAEAYSNQPHALPQYDHITASSIPNPAHGHLPPPQTHQVHQLPTPPPPPVHRNSAPVSTISREWDPALEPTIRSRPSYESPSTNSYLDQQLPSQPMQCSQPPQNLYHVQRDVYPQDVELSSHPQPSFQSHLARDADPVLRPRNELYSDPRHHYSEVGPHSPEALSFHNLAIEEQPKLPALGEHDDVPIYTRGRTQSLVHDHRQTSITQGYGEARQTPPREPVPIVRPKPITPAAAASRVYSTPRKSVSPRPSYGHETAQTAYSPDSFNILNPSHADQQTSAGAFNSKDPVPMYNASPNTTPIRNAPPPAQAEPIIMANGQIKDPTDHLPPSSYAPEPERRDGQRPSTVVSVSNRFGPREARPSPPPAIRTGNRSVQNRYSMPVLEQRDRLYKGASEGKPLSPAQANVLNAGHSSCSPSRAPQVPRKIPL